MNSRRQPIRDIYVGKNRRDLDPATVAALAELMAEIGLMTPISVRSSTERLLMEDGEESDGALILVAGRHRLAAAKQLGWERIDCIEIDVSERETRIWEIAENLHRVELTAQERALQTAELVRLCEKDRAVPAEAMTAAEKLDEISANLGQTEDEREDAPGSAESADVVSGELRQKVRLGRPEGGVAQAARELGIPRTNVRQDLMIAATSPQAAEAAREAGLADNQSALLKIAAEPTPEAQVAMAHRIAQEKAGPRRAKTALEPARIDVAGRSDITRHVLAENEKRAQQIVERQKAEAEERAKRGHASPAQIGRDEDSACRKIERLLDNARPAVRLRIAEYIAETTAKATRIEDDEDVIDLVNIMHNKVQDDDIRDMAEIAKRIGSRWSLAEFFTAADTGDWEGEPGAEAAAE